MNLKVKHPEILASRFDKGLQFMEIINGHKFQSFDKEINIHMLSGEKAGGCQKFSLANVKYN